MGFTLSINGTSGRAGRYISWAPSPCLLRATGTHLLTARTVRVSNRAKPGGGRLVFYDKPGGPARATLTVKVTPLGGEARFWVGGRFGSASRDDGDTEIVFSSTPGGAELTAVAC